MSEKNESVAEVPAEGNSADFFTEPNVASATESKKITWPWTAVAATALVAGLGGYAIGHSSGFDQRPTASMEQLGGPQADGRGAGMHGPDMRGQMGDNDGPLDGRTPHCHDANGQDQAVGTDGKCADGTTPLAPMQDQMKDGRNRGGHHGGGMIAPAPSTSPSTLTN